MLNTPRGILVLDTTGSMPALNTAISEHFHLQAGAEQLTRSVLALRTTGSVLALSTNKQHYTAAEHRNRYNWCQALDAADSSTHTDAFHSPPLITTRLGHNPSPACLKHASSAPFQGSEKPHAACQAIETPCLVDTV